MFRIMTWNCLGMSTLNKRQLLAAYIAAQGIDYVFLQEGAANYINAVAEENSQASIFYPSSTAALPSPEKQILELAFASDGMSGASVIGNGGVSRNAYYNTINTPPASVSEHITDDYVLAPTVRDWVFAPAASCSSMRNGQKKLLGGTSRRPALTDRDWCDRIITSPIQARVNLVAQRRPKIVHLADGGAPFAVHYWHAPLGSTTTLQSVGLLAGNEGIAGEGSGGEVAVAANLLFRKFIDNGGAFPNRTLLVGDLNITDDAVDHIYGGQRLTSEDGWCHIVAPIGATLTLLANSNTKARAAALGGSDHAPIVCDVTF